MQVVGKIILVVWKDFRIFAFLFGGRPKANVLKIKFYRNKYKNIWITITMR